MESIIPPKLKKGDKIVVVSPSDSIYFLFDENKKIGLGRMEQLGFDVTFSKNGQEVDEFDSSSIKSRVEDIHDAFLDKKVSLVITSFGGFNCNQLLRYLDWNLIKNNPKVFLGFSDTTALQNAIYTKTGLVTYSGPSFSSFCQKLYFEYTLDYFEKCLMMDREIEVLPSKYWSDDKWYKDQDNRKLLKNNGWLVINYGIAKGKIFGGNLSTFKLLQGTEYFPDISDSILFLEDDSDSKIFNFDRDLQSVIHLPNFNKVKGLVIGRFQNASEVKNELLIKVIKNKKELDNIPVLANVDFGHTDPMITFPIGGEAELNVSEQYSNLKIIKH